jgi:hypothetical protein
MEGAVNPPYRLGGVLVAVEGCRISCGAVLISVGQSIGTYEGEIGLDGGSYRILQAEGVAEKERAEAAAQAARAAAAIAVPESDFCLDCWLNALAQERANMGRLL